MRSLLPLTALVFTATSTIAQCPTDQHPILSCKIADSQKTLTTCHNGETATYAFGKPGQSPELTITAPVTQINYTPWNGIGRSIYEEVIFENAGVGYLLWAAFEKDPEVAQPLSGGIVVQQDGEDLAGLQCDPDSIELGIGDLFEVMQGLGQCWNYGEFVWQNCQ